MVTEGEDPGLATEGAAPAVAMLSEPSPKVRRRLPDEGRGERVVMMNSLLVLWAIGATFLFVLIASSEYPSGALEELLVIEAVSVAVLAVLAVGRHHMPAWVPEASAYLCSTLVALVIYSLDDPDTPYALFYLSLGVHAFYFLHWRRAVRQVLFIAVAYGATLGAMAGDAFPVGRWTTTVLTAGVICGMVATLKLRVNTLLAWVAEDAATDPGTGLPNRRAFDEVLTDEFERARRWNTPLTLVIGDLDRFKEVNDRLGHLAGDGVLRRLAGVFESSHRQGEPVMRTGGDEFAAVLPNTEAEAAELFTDRMRIAIRREFQGDPVPITISCGIATYPSHCDDLKGLLRAADAAVYAAKAEGGDQCVTADGHQPEGRAPGRRTRNSRVELYGSKR